LGKFPAAGDIGQVGRLFAYFADGGLLGNAVDPDLMTNPKFQFGVVAPVVGPTAQIRSVFMELLTLPGMTAVTR
jgi:hypothetical protein